MSYANPSTNVGVVNYSVVGDNINKSLTNVEIAREEIVTQQKEAQAILDEKFETISDELATKNIMLFGGEVSDALRNSFRELADKGALNDLNSQGFRDLKFKVGNMRSSLDKIAELSSSNVELSKQFDDPALASLVASVRDGDGSTTAAVEDGRLVYTHEYNGVKKTWTDEDIIRESSKFEDVGVKRDKYNSYFNTITAATEAKVKEFAKEGNKYENINNDISVAFQALGRDNLSFLYNELVPDSEKLGLSFKYGSPKDNDGNKLSPKEIAANKIKQDDLARIHFEKLYRDKIPEYKESLARKIQQTQLDKLNKEVSALNSAGKWDRKRWETREISNKQMYNNLKSIKFKTYDEYKSSDEFKSKDDKDVLASYELEKSKIENELMRQLSYAPVSINGKMVPVQSVKIDDNGFANLYGKTIAENIVGEPIITDMPLGKFKLDGSSFENAYNHIVNNLDLEGSARVKESVKLGWGDFNQPQK